MDGSFFLDLFVVYNFVDLVNALVQTITEPGACFLIGISFVTKYGIFICLHNAEE